jgi:hypothetical protein
MSKFRFDGDEIVRLRAARDGVAAGCCGIVWGCYDYGDKPSLYEATFVNQEGETIDVTFEEAHVDQLNGLDQAPFSGRLAEVQAYLTRNRRG